MMVRARDIVPMNQVRARLTELAEDVRSGKEKIITRNGESYVALIDTRRLEHYHRLERAHIHLLLLDEAERGLRDVERGDVTTADDLRKRYGR